MKSEQMQVVTGVVCGRDVFAVLPTGFGKNTAVLPAAFDCLYSDSPPSIVLVMSPLTAIMKDLRSS
jgi:ATP-dependent DNA helicase RecQ